MRKANKKSRKFRFYSHKNQQMIEVYDEVILDFAKTMEQYPNVLSYETSVLLDMSRYANVNRVDIRKEYFETQWESDILIRFIDGSSRVVEFANRKQIMQRAFIEKLDFSVRYWKAMGIDWGLSYNPEEGEVDDDNT